MITFKARFKSLLKDSMEIVIMKEKKMMMTLKKMNAMKKKQMGMFRSTKEINLLLKREFE
jgi:hypothetical protein